VRNHRWGLCRARPFGLRFHPLLLRATPLACLALLAACGTTNGSPFAQFDGGTNVDASAIHDGGPRDAPSVSFGDASFGDAANVLGCTTCSSDLHDVLDCSTPANVVLQCTGTQGCGANGQCIDACAAAALNKSSIGCDYYAIPADAWSDIPGAPAGSDNSDGSCFAAFVTNTWDAPLQVALEWDGMSIDATPYAYIPTGTGTNLTYQPIPSTGIPANQIAIVFMADYGPKGMFKSVCPSSVKAAITTQDVGVHGTGIGSAIHLTTSVPAVVYDIYPYGGASTYIASATLLLPTSAWDTNYIAVAAWNGIASDDEPMDVEVVAMEDNTQVQILPTSAIVKAGTTVQGAMAGTQATYTINKGQVLQFAQTGDLSGSPIQSNNPIGVWGGHYCMTIPDSTTAACDGAHQQIPPVKALGSQYVAIRYASRTSGEESVPWTLVGAVDGTQLTFEPSQAGAPTSLTVGQVAMFSAPGPFVVSSQDAMHPFYVSAHMTGGELATTVPGNGDPETVNVVPPAQFLNSYVFFTDPTYSYTDLVVVRGPVTGATYADVTLDCMSGPLTGWQPIGTSAFEFTRTDVQKGHKAVGTCDNGRHSITSTAPFGITVWGYDQYVSYAYPAGASIRPINSVVVPPTPR
jgi:hypothetical protein